MSIFGYFDDPTSDTPTFDPGLEVDCCFCKQKLNHPEFEIKTISLYRPGDNMSYFYRSHKNCYENALPIDIQKIESFVVDAVEV
jgi:hypothetical protein